MKHEDGDTLQNWACANVPESEKDLWDEVFFIRLKLSKLFLNRMNDGQIRVVGTHKVFSLPLPIYSIAVPGLEVRMWYNMSTGWKVSVKAMNPIALPELFFKMVGSQPTRMEGYDPDWAFGSATNSSTKFSYGCASTYDLYASLTIITIAAGVQSEINRLGWRG